MGAIVLVAIARLFSGSDSDRAALFIGRPGINSPLAVSRCRSPTVTLRIKK
jgi:hypothetical protein